MSTTSIRALLEKPRRTEGSPLAAPAIADDAEYRPYANGRIGNLPQHTLVFRKGDGSVRGFSYSYFYSVESDNPAEGFVIDFAHAKIEVTGKNLDYLFRLVCEHKAAEIVEATRNQHFETGAAEPVVERISFSIKQ